MTNSLRVQRNASSASVAAISNTGRTSDNSSVLLARFLDANTGIEIAEVEKPPPEEESRPFALRIATLDESRRAKTANVESNIGKRPYRGGMAGTRTAATSTTGRSGGSGNEVLQ